MIRIYTSVSTPQRPASRPDQPVVFLSELLRFVVTLVQSAFVSWRCLEPRCADFNSPTPARVSPLVVPRLFA